MSDAYPLGAYDYPILVTPARLQAGIVQYMKCNFTKCATIYSITYSSAPPSQGSLVYPVLDRLPVLPLQVWLTVLD